MDYEKIKNDKIQEAIELFKRVGIKTHEENISELDYIPSIPEFQKKSDGDKNIEFHWTRLSINSNIGCVAE
jgi:hypothetical protein